MKNVMLDLETLGTSPGCIVLSIGAVVVEEPDRMFYRVLSANHQDRTGLIAQGSTLDWWERQSDEAKGVLRESQALSVSPKHALNEFSEWLLAVDGTGVQMWGNGASFDQPILRAVYAAYQVAVAWMYYNERCYRTVKALFRNIQPGKREGVYHNALDDAKYQAAHLARILAEIERMKGPA